MSKMKYLVVLAVCAGMALLVGAPAFATDQVFFTEDLSTNPAWTTEGAWEYGQPTGVDDDPTAGNTGNYVYGYNIFGPYGKNMPQTHLTPESLVGPFDISAVADLQATVYIRWGMASDNLPDTTDPVYDSETGGWNIDDISLTASGDDPPYSWKMSGDPF